MKNKLHTLFLFFIFCALTSSAQNSIYSPYSRYGLGELNQTTFAHNQSMGGAHIAWRPDSTFENKSGVSYFFINSGNPASYALLRVTSLEVGGNFLYSDIKANSSATRKWGTNFGYAAVGFPIRGNGGASFGIMPYSNVGYDVQSVSNQASVGDITYLYNGTGGLNKVFAGYGIQPFKKRLVNFRKKYLYIPDSTKTLSKSSFKTRETFSKLLSDFSIGFNANYIFGNVEQSARVVYPNSILYNNSYRIRTLTMGDFTGNFGIQTAYTIDSLSGKAGRKHRINKEIENLQKRDSTITKDKIRLIKDSLYSVYPLRRIAMREKVKFTFGYFMNLNNPMTATYDVAVYNYILNGSGQEIIRDTVLSNRNQTGTIVLPLEQGFGLGFKKGERLSLMADFAITNWQNFKYLDQANTFFNNHRIALGMNYVPEKGAAGSGAYFRKINYRLGVNYNSGYIDIKNTLINNYSVSAGLGLPVGIGQVSSMVNVGVQYGQMGSLSNNLVKENYWRVNFGFTFSDRWFQKFKYD